MNSFAKLLLYFCIAWGFLNVVGFFLKETEDNYGVLFLFLPLYFYFLSLWKANKQFKALEKILEDREYTFTTTQLNILECNGNKYEIKYETLYSIEETKNLLLIFDIKEQAIVIDKTQIPISLRDDIRIILKIAKDAIKNAKK